MKSTNLSFVTFEVQEWESYGVEHMHLDVGEYFFAPSRLQITAALEMIDRHKKMNHSVYVHCKAGRGRSASVVACYLIKVVSLSPGLLSPCVLSRLLSSMLYLLYT